MDTSTRLRIATRIHFALLRRYGENVEVGTLMKGEVDAREAMWVCEASGDRELVALARQLRQAQRRDAAPVAKAAVKPAPQDAAWARDTSGFGVSRPFELEGADATPASWLRPSSWLRKSAPTRQN